jgi:hypothetical protein
MPTYGERKLSLLNHPQRDLDVDSQSPVSSEHISSLNIGIVVVMAVVVFRLSFPSICLVRPFLSWLPPAFQGMAFKFLHIPRSLPGLCQVCSKNVAAGGRAEHQSGLADTVAQLGAEPGKPLTLRYPQAQCR